MAVNLQYNPCMPTVPGEHGVIFVSFLKYDNGRDIAEDINFFVRIAANKWVYLGFYSVKRFGRLTAAQFKLLPEVTIGQWVDGVCNRSLGKGAVAAANMGLAKDRHIQSNEVSVREALDEGILKLSFTVLEFVEYREDIFEALAAHEPEEDQQPTEPQAVDPSTKRKLKISKATPRKKAKTGAESIRSAATASGVTSSSGSGRWSFAFAIICKYSSDGLSGTPVQKSE